MSSTLRRQLSCQLAERLGGFLVIVRDEPKFGATTIHVRGKCPDCGRILFSFGAVSSDELPNLTDPKSLEPIVFQIDQALLESHSNPPNP